MIGMKTAPARRIFSSANDRQVGSDRARSHEPRVAEIAALEMELEKLSDDGLLARTERFKQLATVKGLNGLPRQRRERQET